MTGPGPSGSFFVSYFREESAFMMWNFLESIFGRFREGL